MSGGTGRLRPCSGRVVIFTRAGEELMQLGLTKSQIEFRRNAIGGSDANKIMGDKPEYITRLWQEKRGEIEPEDLSDVLPVQMGSFTEPLNRYWFEKKTGLTVTNFGDEVLSFEYPHMSATLDGLVIDEQGVETLWEAKHVSAFAKEAEIIARYVPQLHHNMIVTGTERAILSVFYGTMTWKQHRIGFDPMYAEALLAAEDRFWKCVQSGEPPVAGPIIAPPVEAVKVADMSGSNAWAWQAAEWLENGDHAKRFKAAEEAIKELVEADVKEASGHGIIALRSKRGALSIKAVKKHA